MKRLAPAIDAARNACLTPARHRALTLLCAPGAELVHDVPGGWWIGNEQISGQVGWWLLRTCYLRGDCWNRADSLERYTLREEGKRALKPERRRR